MLIQDGNQNDAVNTDDKIYKYKCKIPPRVTIGELDKPMMSQFLEM